MKIVPIRLYSSLRCGVPLLSLTLWYTQLATPHPFLAVKITHPKNNNAAVCNQASMSYGSRLNSCMEQKKVATVEQNTPIVAHLALVQTLQ